MRPAEHEYVTRLDEFRLLPGAVEGMAELAACGFMLVVVSNQRGVARGLVSPKLLSATEKVIQTSLEPHGARVRGFYYCVHEIDEGCECRKPKPGLLLRAARELELDLAACWMLGDTESDIQAGISAGCRTAYLGTRANVQSTVTAGSLGEAAPLVCART